jgi:hypothetical protein
VYGNHKAILSLLAATPSQMAKRRDWNDAVLRRRLALAAYRTARLGALTLSLADELQPGGGYRRMCAHAAKVGHDMQLEARWFWPFEGAAPFSLWERPEDLDYCVSRSVSLM